jgi:N-acetylglucosaminyldiphosphoundecaprenol N-acetyl-beta-D-mannosaminyltransferase
MQTELLGILFEQLTLSEAASQVVEAARQSRKGIIVTPNVDHIVMLQDDAEMRQIYQEALFRYADGMPLVWLSKLVSARPLPERVTGSDLIISVCEKAAGSGLNIYFMGGNPGVAEKAAHKLQNTFKGLNIIGTSCPPFGFEKNAVETDRIIADINALNVDILFIGVGAPKQEKWAAANMDRLNVGPILCVGAAFDFAAGIIKRAPVVVQKSGFEWAWRLACEPTRLWRRYILRDSRFLPLAFKEILAVVRKRYFAK